MVAGHAGGSSQGYPATAREPQGVAGLIENMAERETKPTGASHSVMRCSFCNKAQAEVRKLIAGPTAFICDECVRVCTDIIRAEHESSLPAVEPPPTSPSAHSTRVVTCRLCGLPLPWEDALEILERGFLCPGCTGEVEASLAEKREDVT
jgi:hypothetical protein